MKRFLFILTPIIISVLVFVVLVFIINRQPNKGALQVTSTPASKVYLNDKLIGKTPLCKCDLPNLIDTGSYVLKLVPVSGDYSPFEQKITISPKIITVVDRTFAASGLDQASILTFSPLMDKKAVELSVVSFPSGIQFFLDDNPSGVTPISLKNLTASDHEIKLSKEGYKDKIIKISTKQGFRLEAVVFMGANERETASPSAGFSPAPLPSTSPSASPSAKTKNQVTILNTPTGFLRVRQEASVGSSQVGQVNPGEKYTLISEKNGWYQIKLKDGNTGWISGQYAEKI